MKTRTKKRLPQWKKKEYIFFGVMMIIPMIHFLIWYIGVNGNSISLAFREYDFTKNQYVFAGLENFKNVLNKKPTVLKFIPVIIAIPNAIAVIHIKMEIANNYKKAPNGAFFYLNVLPYSLSLFLTKPLKETSALAP